MNQEKQNKECEQPKSLSKLEFQITEALTCDKDCGHTLELDTCFDHQVERVAKIIDSAKQETLDEIIKANALCTDDGLEKACNCHYALSDLIDKVKRL